MNIAFRRTSGTSRLSALCTAGTQVPFFSAAICSPKVLLSTVRSKKYKKIIKYNVGVENEYVGKKI
jgi:hypothetical protein